MASPGPINRDRSQENYARYQNARSSFSATMQASIERAERRRLEKERAKQEAALEAQRAAALARRDEKQNLYDRMNANHRANIALGAANADFQYQQKLNDQQRRSVRQRDTLQNDFETQQNRQKNRDLRERDERQFGYTTAENDQQFGQQLERDYRQQGYTLDRDAFQQQNTLQRDAVQFGLDSRRQDQQQRQTLQRDAFQSGIQRDRDQRLNQFDTERDIRQNEFQGQRDNRLNMFDSQRDFRRQQAESQNMYQREAADVSTKWQEQVQQAKAAGLDFSPQQQQKMKQMDAVFREKVINGNMDEGLKQRAYLEHARAKAAIIPEDKISTPDQEIASQFYEHPKYGVLKRTIDRNNNASWEPLGMDGGMGDQSGQMKAQMQAEQKQTDAQTKAEFERQERFQDVVESIRMEENAMGEPLYTDDKVILKKAMDRFAPMEHLYRSRHKLPPLEPFLQEADQVRQQQMQQQTTPQPKPPGVNPFKPQANGQRAAGMADSLAARSGDDIAAKTPILSTKPLPKPITEKLMKLPGGDQLVKLREKHQSNSMNDQKVKYAVDIMVESMMANDTSHPDLIQAMEILAKAGITLGK